MATRLRRFAAALLLGAVACGGELTGEPASGADASDARPEASVDGGVDAAADASADVVDEGEGVCTDPFAGNAPVPCCPQTLLCKNQPDGYPGHCVEPDDNRCSSECQDELPWRVCWY